MLERGEMTMDELLDLPVSIGLRDAARALGIGKSAAYEMAANGEFPVPAHRYGLAWRVNRADLFRRLGLDPAMVRAPEAEAS